MVNTDESPGTSKQVTLVTLVIKEGEREPRLAVGSDKKMSFLVHLCETLMILHYLTLWLNEICVYCYSIVVFHYFIPAWITLSCSRKIRCSSIQLLGIPINITEVY